MRKIFAMLLAAVLCLSLAACGGEKATNKTVDAAAMFKALLNDVTYSGDATEFEASETNVAMILGGTLPEGTEAYLAANNSSYLRCAVFACKDKDAAAAVKALIQRYIDESIDAKYNVDEVALLQKAKVHTNGRYVAVAVTDDADGVDKVIAKYFG
ncbi:MAG: DUF4358 domain-containing protein [Angelakisella sp.]|nr:DUF4358 domain-containing protein [Angelakisella sp.]